MFSLSVLNHYFFLNHGTVMAQEIHSVDDIIRLFPKTTQEIIKYSDQAQKLFKKRIDEIINLHPSKYSFENIGHAFDKAYDEAFKTLSCLLIIQMTHSDQLMREGAQRKFIELEKTIIETAYHNVDLYNVFKTYHEQIEPNETLSNEQKQFIKKYIEDLERKGIALPEVDRELVETLEKEIAKLGSDFEQNIAEDNRTIAVSQEDLSGLSDDFINSLEKNNEGLFILGVDYPTVFAVLENCKVSRTRQQIYQAFNNRGNPKNKIVLDELRKKRDQLAHILGYTNYAEFQIADEMAKTPQRVQTFLNNLVQKASEKSISEMQNLIEDLPADVILSPEGKIYPWDVAFLFQYYKKKNINVDEEEVSHYFPVSNTLNELLDIYSQFFGISFELVKTEEDAFWDKDVQLVHVRDSESKKTIGYILLDLFPRANKFSHAACEGVIPVLEKEDSTKTIGLAFVIANFPKETATRPALLKRTDVITFFHEFGHALHHLLSSTQTSYFAGTRVKRDFVEMPSQMLEEWMWDAQILKKVSKHYKTGDPLPDNLIDNILKIKHLESGYWVLKQSMYSQLSLDIYSGVGIDTYDLNKKNCITFLPMILFDPANHFYLSFGHLPTYAAGYYGYLWAKVFAVDLFYYIKSFGLLNSKIGKRFREKILKKGGTVDPDVLLEDFLGRQPSDAAFFKDLGL